MSPSDEALGRWLGLDAVVWLEQQRTPLLSDLLWPLHAAGAGEFYLLLLPALYWSLDRRLGRRLTIVFLMAGWLNGALKLAFALPRPSALSAAVHPAVSSGGFGLPSGHAMMATVLACSLARWSGRPAAYAGAAAYAGLMSFSRVLHGAHFPADVAAGCLFGLMVVAADARLGDHAERWLTERAGSAARWAAALGVPALLLAICPGLIGAADIRQPVLTLAALTGASVGFALAPRLAPFDTEGTFSARLGRAAVGAITLGVVYYGLRVALAPLASAGEPLEHVGRGLRYAVTGAWLAVGAPWVLLRVGLLPRGAETKAASPRPG